MSLSLVLMARSLSEQALSFAEDIGIYLDETCEYESEFFNPLSQAEFVERTFATTHLSGRFHFTTLVDVESRQNGKGETFEAIELFDAYVLKTNCLRNAHELGTAKDAQRRAWERVQACDLAKMVDEHRIGNGELNLTFRDRGGIFYRARTAGSGRGLTKIGRISYDEAQEIKLSQIKATSSTAATVEHYQVGYLGSPGLAHSVYWYDLRLSCIKKENPRTLYSEHTAERVELDPNTGELIFHAPDPQDRENWRRANPGLVHGRISYEFLEDELTRLKEGFAGEHLGVWEIPPKRAQLGAKKLPVEAWKLLIDPRSSIPGTPVITVACDEEQTASAIATGGWRNDHKAHLEIIEYEAGSAWVGPRVEAILSKQRIGGVGLDTSGSGAILATELKAICQRRKVHFHAFGSGKLAVACQGLVTKVDAGQIKHLGDLDTIQALERSKTVGYGAVGWKWLEQSEAPTAPLVAMTLAAELVDGLSKRRSAYEPDNENEEEE